MKRIWIPQTIASSMLLWALNPGNPYGYYILLRWVCCAVFAYLAVKAFEQEKKDWVWVLGITAVVYNPIIRIHLTRDIWSVVNVATIAVAALSVFVLKVQSGKMEVHDTTVPVNHQSLPRQRGEEMEPPDGAKRQGYHVVGTGPRHHCST